MKLIHESEDSLRESAAHAACAWRDTDVSPLIVGLEGDLGAGKTTWVRAALGGLGHMGRVPSPTFTLLEHYEIGPLTILHLDFYRLAEARELEFLGLRDWLALPRVWFFAEWPEQGGAFADSLDIRLRLDVGSDDRRTLMPEARTESGRRAVAAWLGRDFK